MGASSEAAGVMGAKLEEEVARDVEAAAEAEVDI